MTAPRPALWLDNLTIRIVRRPSPREWCNNVTPLFCKGAVIWYHTRPVTGAVTWYLFDVLGAVTWYLCLMPWFLSRLPILTRWRGDRPPAPVSRCYYLSPIIIIVVNDLTRTELPPHLCTVLFCYLLTYLLTYITYLYYSGQLCGVVTLHNLLCERITC